MIIVETDISKRYKTKQEIAYDEIKNLIINCTLEPETQVVIRTIASNMNISEIPVREALKRLISENFVIERNSNLYVAPITKEDYLDLIDVRTGLERIAIRLTARKITSDEIEILSKMLKQMKEYFDNGDLKEYDKMHIKFHLYICLLCDLAPLQSALKECFDHCSRCKKYFKLESWNTYPSYDAHEKIFEALKNKNVEDAEKYLVENRVNAAHRFREKIKNL